MVFSNDVVNEMGKTWHEIEAMTYKVAITKLGLKKS